MTTLLVSQFYRGNGVRCFVPSIGSYISARTKASTVTFDSVSDTEQSLLANAKPFEEIPCIKTFPVIGSSWIYLPLIGKYKINKLHFADVDKHKTYGSIYREKLGPQHLLSIYDPEDIEKLFRQEGQYPVRGGGRSLKAYRDYRKEWYTTKGIILLEGKEWYDFRSKIQPHIMRPKVIKAYITAMESVAEDFVDMISNLRDENKEIPNFLGELHKWALESIALVGLDIRLGCLGRNLPAHSESLKMITSAKTTIECMAHMELFSGSLQLWKLFPTPSWRKFVKAMDFFTFTAFNYINRASEDMKNKDEDQELTLLQSMLNTSGLDESNIMVLVNDLLLAGIDSTSTTVGFLLYHLARNPSSQEKLHEELVGILPGRSDRLNSTVLNEFRYLKACMKESMRMNATSRGIGRRLNHDIILSGYRIPAGVTVVAMIQVNGRQEKYYKDADKFIPERWMDKEDKPHPFLFLPFGFGPRSCIGRRLAELEIMCLVSEIIRNYKVEYHHEDIGMFTGLTNYPDRPLNFRFVDRPF